MFADIQHVLCNTSVGIFISVSWIVALDMVFNAKETWRQSPKISANLLGGRRTDLAKIVSNAHNSLDLTVNIY